MTSVGASQGKSSGETDEEEDEESSSSSDLQPVLPNLGEDIVGHTAVSSTNKEDERLADVVAAFRREWKNELTAKYTVACGNRSNTTDYKNVRNMNSASESGGLSPSSVDDSVGIKTDCLSAEQLFENAKILFARGIHEERIGNMPEAVRFYRLSMQLVPDIEHQFFRAKTLSDKAFHNSAKDVCKESEIGHAESMECDGDILEQLLSRFADMTMMDNEKRYCRPNQTSAVGCHISQLSAELLVLIFKYAVSREVDMRVLEQLSLVCTGFYVLSRDKELWHLACTRIWGVRTGSLDCPYKSWRDMFILRPHVFFNGVYISRNTYIRHGEPSYQDQYYRPWYLVVYYRYLRFFADGTVLMYTTADEPMSALSHLRSKKPKFGNVLVGTYRLTGKDSVTATFQRERKPETQSLIYARRALNRMVEPIHTFHMELLIKKKRKTSLLLWSQYSVTVSQRNLPESTTKFDVDDHSFAPFYFSRVRSWTAASDEKL